MNKTVSQKIARVFEIAGYLWLLPSTVSLIFPVMFAIMAILAGNPSGLIALAVIFGIFGAGVFLLVNYYRHSRGWLDEEKILPLWFGTLVFNLIFLSPVIYFYWSMPSPDYGYHDSQIVTYNSSQIIILLMWLLPPFWWTTAALLSGVAIVSEIWNQKYR
jgi:hypothetical protein